MILSVALGGLLALPLAPAAIARSDKNAPPVAASANENAALRKRVRQLEEQLLDMQVMIGTLQSMTKSGGGSSGAAVANFQPAVGGGDSARMRQIETQIQALTAQMQSLSEQVRGGQGRRGDAGADTISVPGRSYADSPTSPVNGLRPSSAPFSDRPVARGAKVTGFGSTTVTPSPGDNAGNTIGGDSISDYLSRDQRSPASSKTSRLAAARGNSKQSYETAYGYLLQQNFSSAQSAFSEFLQQYPNDPLAGNAQYWLGETFYVRRKYRSAAKAFLKGYQSYKSSNKAPDSLLKLAMSFDRLGQKDAACSSFGELRVKFPRAPSHVTDRAKSEAKRLGCQ